MSRRTTAPQVAQEATSAVAKPTIRKRPSVQAKVVTPPEAQTLLQRAQEDPLSLSQSDVQHLHSAAGDTAVQRLANNAQVRKARRIPVPVPEFHPMPAVQAKLSVGPANDRYEQEAERVSQDVVRRVHTDEFEQTQPTIQRAVGLDGGEVDESLAASIRSAKGGGQPLPDPLKQSMGTAMGGADFAGVRVHTDANADHLNRSISARAFTTGSDLFFKRGEYNPGSSAGQKLIAHELTHTIQQGAVSVQRKPGKVQRATHGPARRQLRRSRFTRTRQRDVVQAARTALTPKEILAALKNIKFLKGKLKTSLHGETMERRVGDMLRAYNEHFAKKTNEDVNIRDAMMLSMALDGVARVISEELNDASVQPVVAEKLVELYKPDIEKKVKSQKWSLRRSGTARTKVMDLTKAFMAGDPVTQYMHREIRLDVAGAQIRTMAAEARKTDPNVTDIRMFELMEQRFQTKMASYNKDQLHKYDPTKMYGLDETQGEYSQYFFKKLFGDNVFANSDQATWNAGGAGQEDRLAFTADTEAKLTALRQEVTNPTLVPNNAPRAGVTVNQERHLSQIEAEENTVDRGAIKDNFVKLFIERYYMTRSAAEKLYQDIGTFLNNAPLTITVKAADWFKPGQMPDPNFKPSTGSKAQTPMQQAFGRGGTNDTIEHLPTWKDKDPNAADARGDKYLRFRNWKDQLLTGLNNLATNEMAVFGALNVNWDTSKGTDDPKNYGSNYYGDLHFVLDKTRFANRMIYTATDHGQQRRDPMLALNDFGFGGRGLTWLKDTKRIGMIDNIVNAVRSKTPIAGLPLMFEIQVFGGINIKQDVTAVHVSPKVSLGTFGRIQNYYAGTGINVLRVPPAPGNLQAGGAEIHPLDIMRMVTGTRLSNTEQQESDTATAGQSNLDSPVIKSAYTLAFYIKKTANTYGQFMTTEDFKAIDEAVKKMKGLNTSVQKMNSVPGPIKTRLDQLAIDAEQAVTDAKQLQLAQPQLRGSNPQQPGGGQPNGTRKRAMSAVG